MDHAEITSKEVLTAINQLKLKKASDINGLSSEHLKYGGLKLIETLVALFNKILDSAIYPDAFKMGCITPIHKKAGKVTYKPTNYTKITITSIIGKTFEKIYLWRVRPPISRSQSLLQFGFTMGKSPMMAALMMTEAITEAQSSGETLYIAFLDTKKAFDVIWHNSLLRRLYLLGIDGKLWLTAQSLYSNMKGQVKWQGHHSRDFQVKHGLLQGGVTSADFHKPYEDPLLHLLEDTGTGLHIGSSFLGTITLCDDKTVLSKHQAGLQIGLDACTNHANRERYENGIEKSQVMACGGTQKDMDHTWVINNDKLLVTPEYSHIGIKRTHKPNTNLGEDVAKKMRSTAYGLM